MRMLIEVLPHSWMEADRIVAIRLSPGCRGRVVVGFNSGGVVDIMEHDFQTDAEATEWIESVVAHPLMGGN